MDHILRVFNLFAAHPAAIGRLFRRIDVGADMGSIPKDGIKQVTVRRPRRYVLTMPAGTIHHVQMAKSVSLRSSLRRQ